MQMMEDLNIRNVFCRRPRLKLCEQAGRRRMTALVQARSIFTGGESARRRKCSDWCARRRHSMA